MKIIKEYKSDDLIPNNAQILYSQKKEDGSMGFFFLIDYIDPKAKVKKETNKNTHNQIIFNVISYLNEKTGSCFRANTSGNRKLLMARINDKYTEEDLKRVIDNKASEWLDDPVWSKYLRPATLFSASKIESYLGQAKEENPFDELDRLIKS